MYRIGIDVGGTFTDLVAVDEDTGAFRVEKSPSTSNPIHGILKVLNKSKVPKESIKDIIHGTTVATNALIQRKLKEEVAFVATKGFGDILFIQKTHRRYHYDLHWNKPEPLVKKRNCFEINERIDYKGKILQKLDVEKAEKVIQEIKKRKIRAIAISFLFHM